MREYEEAFLKGYLDALNEDNETYKKELKAAKKAIGAAAAANAITGAGIAAGGTALAVRQHKKIADYSARLGELKKKKNNGTITPEELKEYKKLIAKTAIRGAIAAGSAGAAVNGAVGGVQSVRFAHKANKEIKKAYGESYEEAFLEGYLDALNEM